MKKICPPNDLEARCEFRILGHLGGLYRNGAAGGELPLGPQPLSSHHRLHPAL